MNILLRRKRLGRTSCREVGKHAGLIPIRNDLLYEKVNEPVDWLFRWGCTSQAVARHTVNKADSITKANNKAETRKILAPLRNKNTKIIPYTWFTFNSWRWPGLGFPLILPVIVRPTHHAQGKQLYFCTTENEVRTAIKEINGEYYISEYINKDAEYRIFVAQNRVVWVTEKTPGNPEDVAWNVAKGGRFDNVNWSNWPLRACRIALQTCEAVGLDFGGVDIIKQGKDFYVLEVNSAPSQTSPYRQLCTGKAFKYIIDSKNKKLKVPDKINSYKDCIHPAITETAKNYEI